MQLQRNRRGCSLVLTVWLFIGWFSRFVVYFGSFMGFGEQHTLTTETLVILQCQDFSFGVWGLYTSYITEDMHCCKISNLQKARLISSQTSSNNFKNHGKPHSTSYKCSPLQHSTPDFPFLRSRKCNGRPRILRIPCHSQKCQSVLQNKNRLKRRSEKRK